MKKLMIMLWMFSIYSYASLIGSNFSQRDLQILEDLDIKSSFITDYKLQETYNYYINRKNHYNYIEKLSEASLFVPKVKDVLRQEGIPDVFIYMAMAESNFDIDARSNAKATGLWQFMEPTANRFDLRMDPYVDERMDLVKSSVAASNYLNSLYERFDKWYLAAISYNCGEGRMIEAITRATIDLFVEKFPSQENTEKIRTFRNVIKDYQDGNVTFGKLDKVYKKVKKWNIKPDLEDLLRVQEGFDRQYLPKESRDYIRKIISLAMMNSQSFISNGDNSHLLNMGISTTVATVPVKGGLHLINISKAIGMKYENLKSLNKHLKRNIIPPTEKFYTINIPYSRLSVYNQNKDQIKDTKFAVHVVKSGDTLGAIARKYKITINEIRKQNKLKSDLLSIKQNLLLPIPTEMLAYLSKNNNKSVAKKSKKRKTIKYSTYKVKSGDTLGGLAYKYNTTMKDIKRKNKLKSNLLSINQKLIIPVGSGKKSKKRKTSKYTTYKVKSGDTLGSLAYKYKTTLKEIRKKNKLRSDLLSINQKLVLPALRKKTTKRHTVKSGDSLYSISKKYKINVKKLMKDNKLKSHLLKIGDRLVIR